MAVKNREIEREAVCRLEAFWRGVSEDLFRAAASGEIINECWGVEFPTIGLDGRVLSDHREAVVSVLAWRAIKGK